ncbi:MAG: TolC family protein [Bacteroidota bacterium]
MKRYSLAGILFLLCQTLAFSQTQERLSLQEALSIALQNNPEIIAAGRTIDASRGRYWQAISLPAPELSVNYDYIPPGSGFSKFGERFIGVTQAFDFPTTIMLRGSASSSETDAAEAASQSVSNAVALQVKQAYYGVLAKERKLRLAEENLGIAEDFAGKAIIRYNVGEGTYLEQLTATMKRTQAQNAVEVSRNDLRLAEGELHYALGRGSAQRENELELTDSLSYQHYALKLDSLVELAYEWNPQIRSAAFRLEAGKVRRTIAWSSILPSFSVSYSRQLAAGGPDYYGVAFGMSLPLWSAFDQRGQIEEASATAAVMESELLNERNRVYLNVKNTFLDFTNEERQMKFYQTAMLPQADEVYRSAAMSYQSGEITYLEFLEARQTLISVRDAHIDALFNYNCALARLENAVGRSINE